MFDLVRKSAVLAVAVFSVMSPLWAQAEALPASAQAMGFELLFDGTTLEGWQGLALKNPNEARGLSADELAQRQAAADESMRQHWSVEEGALAFDGEGESLVSVNQFSNFELWLEWKIEANGDSGIYLRGLPQVQLWDPENLEQRKHGNQHGSGGIWNNPEDQGKFPLVRADLPVGEWNQLRVRMVGEKVSVWLNGQLVVDDQTLNNYWNKGQPLPERGPIELQAHGHRFWVRNIALRELQATDSTKE